MANRIKGITVEIGGDTTKLKTAQKQAEQALAEGKISREQYDALKREIIETEQALMSLERQGATTYQTLQNIAITGEKWQNTGQNIENVGRKMMPVYLGGTLLDEVIVNASMRKNLRSGGRSDAVSPHE